MNEIMATGLGLLGGLALFLYGMNLMSGSLQEVAGERMRAILAAVTRNPVVGVLAGALATAALQSSSATTVMVIGFVSAGLMRLPQAIPIIMGANIGTTITAQIIAFKLSDYVLAFVFAGFILMTLAKGERAKLGGRAVFGFGLLFLGIDTMGAAMKPLAANPVFTDLIAQVAGVPVLGVVVGLACLTTAIGLTGATAAYFERMTRGRLPYRAGVLIVIGCGLLICNLGLEAIIALATPILSVVCPPFMTTVVLILFLRRIHTTWAYKGAALGALLASLVIVAHDSFGLAPFVTALPLYEFGFSWLPFAVAGGVIGWLAAKPAGRARDLLDAPVEKAVEAEGSPIG